MIETPRLILRPPIYSDFQPMIEMFSEEPVLRQIGKLNRSEIWTRLLRDVGHWQLMGFGQFSIIERAQNTYTGKVGFAVFERPLGRANTNIEMSWTLQSRFHGRGYATEAAQAVQHWFERDHKQRTACLALSETYHPFVSLNAWATKKSIRPAVTRETPSSYNAILRTLY